MTGIHLTPLQEVVAITVLLLLGAAVIVAAFSLLDRFGHRADRLGGWWHQQASAGQRWTPAAWARACDLSQRQSVLRRERNPR